MEEKFNILEFLRYAPYGLELYSPICGKVTLKEVTDSEIIVNNVFYKKKQKVIIPFVFDSEGRYSDYSNGECLLFPSEEIRNWKDAPQVLFPKSLGSVVFFGKEISAVCGKDQFYRMRYDKKFPDVPYDFFDWHDYFGEVRYAKPDEYDTFFVLLDNAGYKLNEDGILETTWEPQAGDVVSLKDDSSKLYHLIKNEDGFGFNYVITSPNGDGGVGGGGPITADEIRQRFRLVSRLKTPEEYIQEFFTLGEGEEKEESLDEIIDEMVNTFKDRAMHDIRNILNKSLVDAVVESYRQGILDTIKKYGAIRTNN